MAESQAKRDWMKKNTVQGTIKLYRNQSTIPRRKAQMKTRSSRTT